MATATDVVGLVFLLLNHVFDTTQLSLIQMFDCGVVLCVVKQSMQMGLNPDFEFLGKAREGFESWNSYKRKKPSI